MERGSQAGAVDWLSLRAAFPWLAELPAHVVVRVDLGELAVPGAEALAIIERAQARLPAYLMSYRRDAPEPPAGSVQLCQVLRAARLTGEELQVVREAERRIEPYGVVLCAYARPLSLREQPSQPV
jgi:hypothetical protein